MHPDTAQRGRLLHVALVFLGLDVTRAAMPSGLGALHTWLDTWHGIGLVEHGLARQDRDLSMTRYGLFWSADVYWTGHVHAQVQATGWQPIPWAAVQQAAFRAPHKAAPGAWTRDRCCLRRDARDGERARPITGGVWRRLLGGQTSPHVEG